MSHLEGNQFVQGPASSSDVHSIFASHNHDSEKQPKVVSKKERLLVVTGIRGKHLRFFVTLFFLVLLVAVILTGVFYAKIDHTEENIESGNAPSDTHAFNKNTSLDLEAYGSITLLSFDTNGGLSYQLRYQVGPNVTNVKNGVVIPQQTPLACLEIADPNTGDDELLTLPYPNTPTKSLFGNISTDGFVSRYPFDVYRGLLWFAAAFDPTNPPPTNTTCLNISEEDTQLLQILIQVEQGLEGFEASFQFSLAQNGTLDTSVPQGTIQVAFTVKRARVVLAMAVIMFVVTWLLTLAIVAATMQVVLYRKEPHFELAGAAAALLFALPTLRSAQPGIPTTPTIYDAVGYFWNIALLGFCIFALLANSVWMMRAEKYQDMADSSQKEERETLLPSRGRTM